MYLSEAQMIQGFGSPAILALGAGLIVTTAFAYLLFILRKPAESIDESGLKVQSAIVEGTSGARRSGLTQETISRLYPDVSTVYEAFMRGLRISGDLPCLGTRLPPHNKYAWINYKQVHTRAYRVGCGLVALGCAVPSQQAFVGIYGPNNAEWFLADLACQMFSMISVPIYDTHGPDACVYIIDQANLKTIICHESKVKFLLSSMDRCKGMRNIVKIGGPLTELEKATAEKQGIRIIGFQELEVIGEAKPCEKRVPLPGDVFTVCYTSGTTGIPKGAMLTHDNIISDLSAFGYVLKQYGRQTGQDDVHLSYLPLAHMYERVNQILIFMTGGRIGFFSGNIKMLLDDFKELRPTVFPAVPRLLNRIYDKITNEVNRSPIKSWIFNVAMNAKKRDLQRKIVRNNTLWDYLVFRKIQNLLGGRVWLIISGSAPLSPKVATFMRCVMGCYVQEGYGQTEATASTTLQLLDDFTAGHVGPPVPVNLVKLVDVPEMDYFAEINQGEICIKGRNVFKGYLNNPEKTAEVLDDDGWLHTGDIGEWTQNGTLRIIDRKNNIFKLAQGEYIAPEKIENIYQRSPFVAQIFVHGDRLRAYLVAILVPDGEVLEDWARENGITGSLDELCQNEGVCDAIFQDMVRIGKEASLNSLEQVKGIHVHPEPLSVENGLLTPTMKTKRPVMAKLFRQVIDELYQTIDNKSAKV